MRQQATPEDVDHRAARGLDRALFQKLTGGEWIERYQDLLVSGPTGTGKTWLFCALGHRACRDNRSVLYQRVPRLLEALGLGARRRTRWFLWPWPTKRAHRLGDADTRGGLRSPDTRHGYVDDIGLGSAR